MKVVAKISLKELKEMAEKMYGSFVKADVDVVKKVVIIDMEMHADGEAELLKQGSNQENLWGLNLFPAKYGAPGFIEFDSMINLKPRQNNTSRSIADPAVRQKISQIIDGVVHD